MQYCSVWGIRSTLLLLGLTHSTLCHSNRYSLCEMKWSHKKLTLSLSHVCYYSEIICILSKLNLYRFICLDVIINSYKSCFHLTSAKMNWDLYIKRVIKSGIIYFHFDYKLIQLSFEWFPDFSDSDWKSLKKVKYESNGSCG
jgi:hypothetical protein